MFKFNMLKAALSLTANAVNGPTKTERETLTHKVEVPRALGWDHEETKETVREQHLHLLIVGGEVAMGIVASVLVIAAPLKPERSQLVGCQ